MTISNDRLRAFAACYGDDQEVEAMAAELLAARETIERINGALADSDECPAGYDGVRHLQDVIEHSMRMVVMLKDDRDAAIARAEKAEAALAAATPFECFGHAELVARIQQLETDHAHIVKINAALRDRPDLGDRARRVQELVAERDAARAEVLCRACGGTVGAHLAPDQGGCPGRFEIDGVPMVPVAHVEASRAEVERLKAELAWEQREWPKQMALAIGKSAAEMGRTPSMLYSAVSATLDAARAEVERLKSERAQWQAKWEHTIDNAVCGLSRQLQAAEKEAIVKRDEAIAWKTMADARLAERDAARAEVERLKDRVRAFSEARANAQAEVERLRAELELAKGSLDSLRNFLGDMTIKLPVGRVIQEVQDLRAYRERTEAALMELCSDDDDQAGYEPLSKRLRKLGLARDAKEGA